VTALIVLMGALQLAALVVRLMRKGWQAALLLAASAVMPLVAYVINLVQRAPLDPASWKMLLVTGGTLVLALVSLWRPVAVLFYLAFFWHPFG